MSGAEIFRRTRRWAEAHPATALAAGAAVMYSINLGAADLLTDEAKDALNITYPHPPLLRWLMVGFQSFGAWNEFWARLPVVLFGAASVALMFLLVRQLFGNRRWAAFAAVAFALLPPQIIYARSAYLSVPVTTFWLLGFWGIARLAEKEDDTLGHWCLTLGLAGGLWTELQGAIFLPVWAWWHWRHRNVLVRDLRARLIALIGLLQVAAFGLYVLGSPQILADIFAFARGGSVLVSNTHHGLEFSWLLHTLAGWCIPAAAAIIIGAAWLKRQQLLQPEGLALAGFAALNVILLTIQPSEYYTPYLAVTAVPLAVLLLSRFGPRTRRLAFCTALAVGIAWLPQAYFPGSVETWYRRNAAEISKTVGSAPTAVILGNYGYEVQYYFPVPARKLPAKGDLRLDGPVFVFRPNSLDSAEQAVLKNLHFDRLIGGVAVYRAR